MNNSRQEIRFHRRKKIKRLIKVIQFIYFDQNLLYHD